MSNHWEDIIELKQSRKSFLEKAWEYQNRIENKYKSNKIRKKKEILLCCLR